MSQDTEIIQASLENLDEVSRLFQAYRMFYKKSPEPEKEKSFLKERITNNESIIYLAKREDKFIGFVQLYPIFSSVRMKRLWLLNDLYIEDGQRESGAATLLINKSKELAVKTGAAGLVLETENINHQAQKLYDKTGFTKDENFFHYYWDNSGNN